MRILDLFARHIYIKGSIYMRRWMIPTSEEKLSFPFGLRVHNMVSSDPEKELHDHPFDFVSIILRGGYFEVTQAPGGGERRVWHGPGSILFRRAETLHRIELAPETSDPMGVGRWLHLVGERQAWTFVIRGPIRRSWGFMTKTGWKHWREFIEEREAPKHQTDYRPNVS